MRTTKGPGTWNYLFYKNTDLLYSILLTALMYLFSIIFKNQIDINNTIAVSIFIGILTVNFTVFAIIKFLVANYPKITSERIKQSIDAVFRTPIKNSIIGIIFTIFKINFDFIFLNMLVIYLIFYSLLSTWEVFKTLYEFYVRRISK